MTSIQTTQHHVPADNTLQSPPDEVDIIRALIDWRAWRLTLTNVVQGYVSACSNLNLACSVSLHQPHKWLDIETVLRTIDVELPGLALEEAILPSARTSLAVMRNMSRTLIPIQTLPPEILARIFFITQGRFNDTYDSRELPPTQLLAGVCTYWRRVVVNTPSLWTRIKVTTSQTSYDYAILSLNRSKNLPICLTVTEPEPDEAQDRWSWNDPDIPYAFLAQASPRIQALHVDSWEYSTEAIDIVLKYWLDYGSSGGGTKILRIIRPNVYDTNIAPHSRYDWGFDLLSAEHAENVLRPLSILELHDVFIPWASAAYHNLVDLRLQFTETSRIKISVSQLTAILASSPGLVNLQLDGLEVTPLGSWNGITVVHLIHLEMLYLGRMSGSSCELLLPLINLSSCANYLDVTLDFHNPTRETICLMQDFLRNTPTLTLVCTDTKYISAPEWALSVSAAVSSLDRLLLFAFGCAQSRNPARAMAIEDQLIGSEGELNATITPPLPQLFIAKSAVTLAQLKAIVSRYRIQTIYLDSCHLDSLMAPSHDRDTVAGMNEMKKDLLEFAPNVQCVISSDDTTWRWRCRTIFNY